VFLRDLSENGSDLTGPTVYIYTLVTYTTVFSISLRKATLQVDVLKTLTGMLSLSAQSLVV